jgi:hypothetical protein
MTDPTIPPNNPVIRAFMGILLSNHLPLYSLSP